MSDLTINYSLTTCEKLLFPLAPAYGIRHLRQEGWQNKVIGVIELCPLLGPIVALIERAVIAIFQQVNRHQIWKEEFKANALAHFNTVQDSKMVEPNTATITLSPEQEETLTKAVAGILKFRTPKNVTIHSRNNNVDVFSIKGIPDIIFKYNWTSTDEDSSLFKRVEDTQKAKAVIESENLYLLHVPKQKIHNVDTGSENVAVLVEQKFDIVPNYRTQKNLFHMCINDEELQPFIQECTRQLIILIAQTGYEDVRFDNNPLLTNGQGMALIDLDTSDNPVTGLISGCANTGDDGILRHLTPEMIDAFEPLLRKYLSEEDFQRLQLSKIKAENQTAFQRNQQFPGYLTSHKILTTREKVSLQGWTLTPSKYAHTQYVKTLESTVNEIASYNLGICPVDERKFYIRKDVKEESLTKLKEKGKIFDWEPLSGEFYHGFYVWC